jgi:hypothetical protein
MADTLIVQGSTTFARRLMELARGKKIEAGNWEHELAIRSKYKSPARFDWILIEGRAQHGVDLGPACKRGVMVFNKRFPTFDLQRDFRFTQQVDQGAESLSLIHTKQTT